MAAEEIFKVVGAIAGIGGLAIGLFFLVVRLVLKNVPRPLASKVSSTQFFNLLNKIILFAFILALVGMIIYVVLEINRLAQTALQKSIETTAALSDLKGKYDQLRKENDDLAGRLRQIEDPGLKAVISPFEILSTDLTYDLTGWKAVKPEDKSVRKESSVVYRTKRRVARANEERREFEATFAALSPFAPDFSCKTHTMTATPNADPIPPRGKESLPRWILRYDVKNEPLFQPFDIVTEITVWNTMQNLELEHEGTLILFPTRRVSLEVIFPESKPPTSTECYSYPLGNDQTRTPFLNPNVVQTGKTHLKWTIDEPRLGFHYEIEWKW